MTISSGGWMTASVHLPRSRRIAIAASDGSITLCGIVRGTYDIVRRVETRPKLGVPHCLCGIADDNEDYVIIGDDGGRVAALLTDLETTNHFEDRFEVLHEHRDWVTQVRDVRDVGLVSSSLDSTIRIYDTSREKLIGNYGHHHRGVHAFEYCHAYSLFASGGVERNIVLWQGATHARKIGELIGHTSSIIQLAIDEKSNNVISLSLDQTVKLWDLRNHKCLQTIEVDDWPNHVDTHVACMTYDSFRRRLLTCGHRIYVWQHKLISQDKSGHQYPVKEVVYNRIFHVAVSADEEGTICVWNMEGGARESKFIASHGHDAKLTTVAFDGNQRRLLTAASRGSLKMWNFNSGASFDNGYGYVDLVGSLLREYVHGVEDLEMTTAFFVSDHRTGCDKIIASGWSSKIFIWEDSDDDSIARYKTLDGHNEDILHMAGAVSLLIDYASRIVIPVCEDRDLLATGDYEGKILIWKLSTGAKLMALFHRADRYEASVDKLTWVTISNETGEILLLLSAGGDGIVRVWLIEQESKLIATVNGAHGHLEQVSAMKTGAGYVAIGDTAGHVKILNTGDPDVVDKLVAGDPSLQVHWIAHGDAVSAIDFVPMDDDAPLLLTCSKNTHVCLWTIEGGLVGRFGRDTWSIIDRTTWRDPTGEHRRQPTCHRNTVFTNVPFSFVIPQRVER